MRRLILVLGLLWGVWGSAAGADTLFVSVSQTVHLRFVSELKYVNLGSRVLVAKIVDGSKDFVAVKAREAFDFCTSMSCLESNGEMHTFVVAYAERPGRLEVDTRVSPSTAGTAQQVTALALAPADSLSLSSLSNIATMKQELYHIGTSGYGLQILCENIFYKDDVLFLLVSVKNSSAVSYELATPRFAVESARRTKRGLQYEKAVFPRASYGLGAIASDTEGRLVFTFDKIALVKGQVFRMYFYEKGGARNLVVTMNGKDVNGAKRL
jgi:hypothetical protein